MPLKLFPSLVLVVDRQEERSRVGRVNQDRQAQFAARLPDRIPARIIDANERAIRVAINQAEVFENFEAAGSLAFQAFKFGRHAMAKSGRWQSQLAGSSTAPEPRQSILAKMTNRLGYFRPQELLVLGKTVSHLPIEADAYGDVLRVHDLDILVEQVGRLMQANPRMHVDIDRREFGFTQVVLGNFEHRLWPKLVERQLSALAAIERSRHCRGSGGF